MKPAALLISFLTAACCLVAQNSFVSVPILCYHRVSDGKPGNTTVTPEHFRSQLQTLHDAGFHVIPLAELVAWKSGKGAAPKPHSVVITFDDGHESFFSNAEAIIDRFHVPVTQFLVANCISNGSYCVTWEQIAKLEKDPLIDLESHTWSHPTFPREMRRRKPKAYTHLVDFELNESKMILENKLNRPVPMLAWPYGIYTPMLLRHAVLDGYKVAFSVECRSVTEADAQMAIPRCMVLDSYLGGDFVKFLRLADEAAVSKPANKNWRVMPVAERVEKKTE